jgi:ABC-type multidrug transport system permease subunit
VALPDRVDWPNLHRTLVVIGWMMAATAVACGLAVLLRFATPFFGLLERLFYAVTLLWFLVVSLHFV